MHSTANSAECLRGPFTEQMITRILLSLLFYSGEECCGAASENQEQINNY